MVLGTRGSDVWWVKISGEKCRVQVTLDGANSVGAVVPALRERLFGIGPATVTILRQFGSARGNFGQGAASLCNCAPQMIYQHPWGTEAHALPKLLLPAFVRNLLDMDVATGPYDLIHQAPVQALAMCSELAFLLRKPPSRGEVTSTVLPDEAPLATLLDPPLPSIVRRLLSPALAVELAC